jgi:hypothetical protein
MSKKLMSTDVKGRKPAKGPMRHRHGQLQNEPFTDAEDVCKVE